MHKNSIQTTATMEQFAKWISEETLCCQTPPARAAEEDQCESSSNTQSMVEMQNTLKMEENKTQERLKTS